MGSAVYKIIPSRTDGALSTTAAPPAPTSRRRPRFGNRRMPPASPMRAGHAIEISAPGREADRLAPMQQG